MIPLRRRMTEDMQVRNLSLQTQATYVQQVSLLLPRHYQQVTGGYWDLRRFALTRFISRTKGSSAPKLYYHRRSGSTLPLQNHTP